MILVHTKSTDNSSSAWSRPSFTLKYFRSTIASPSRLSTLLALRLFALVPSIFLFFLSFSHSSWYVKEWLPMRKWMLTGTSTSWRWVAWVHSSEGTSILGTISQSLAGFTKPCSFSLFIFLSQGACANCADFFGFTSCTKSSKKVDWTRTYDVPTNLGSSVPEAKDPRADIKIPMPYTSSHSSQYSYSKESHQEPSNPLGRPRVVEMTEPMKQS